MEVNKVEEAQWHKSNLNVEDDKSEEVQVKVKDKIDVNRETDDRGDKMKMESVRDTGDLLERVGKLVCNTYRSKITIRS